nr:MAG TPA: hypothetical protein [Caudoviricetes sp.]
MESLTIKILSLIIESRTISCTSTIGKSRWLFLEDSKYIINNPISMIVI